ncbi:MAG TPA: rhamnogalacturonan acetylesterase [Bacteroidales bacterium]
MIRYSILILSALILSSGTLGEKKQKPTIWLIGDSTVKNGSGKGAGGLWGWGDYLYQQFDTTEISVKNYALGGRSSRTFLSEGLWDKVLAQIKPGDFVIMQFGHNDNGPVNDNFRARGTIKGIGDETEEIDNILTKKHEIVHSFGWYLRKFASDTKSKGATPVICSLIPRNSWKDGKVVRSSEDFAKWAQESALAEKAFFINLNEIIAKKYEAIGQDEIKAKYFLTDNTHTTETGAILNATAVAEGIRSLKKCKLNKYLLPVTH